MLLHPRQIQQIPYQLVEPGYLPFDARQLGAVPLLAADQRLCELDAGQGAAQLVGDVGEQLLLLLDHVLEGIDHATDMFGQLAYLVAPPQVGDLYFQVALGELGDRLLQLQYGAGQAPGEQQTERGADQHGDAQDLDGVIQDLDEEEQVGVFDVQTEIDVIGLAVMDHLEGPAMARWCSLPSMGLAGLSESSMKRITNLLSRVLDCICPLASRR